MDPGCRGQRVVEERIRRPIHVCTDGPFPEPNHLWAPTKSAFTSTPSKCIRAACVLFEQLHPMTAGYQSPFWASVCSTKTRNRLLCSPKKGSGWHLPASSRIDPFPGLFTCGDHKPLSCDQFFLIFFDRKTQRLVSAHLPFAPIQSAPRVWLRRPVHRQHRKGGGRDAQGSLLQP